jgi:transposase
MKLDIKEVLEKILLPVREGWELNRIELDETNLEVNVFLDYTLDTYNKEGVDYSLYDGRTERKWRHIDLWQYKTFIHCKLPRFIDQTGKVKTIDVPWAEPFGRISLLLEKKQ